MKTIELSEQESKRWNNDAGFRREARKREEARAQRLSEAVELYHIDGRRLLIAAPAEA